MGIFAGLHKPCFDTDCFTDSADQKMRHRIRVFVDGRPAGSTLAARLGKQGMRVLIVERAVFPSLPAVSSPMINAATLEMLDEIGADEAEYARGTPKIRRMVQSIGPGLTLPFELPDLNGRNYGYAIDRARFDAALWKTALRYPTLERPVRFRGHRPDP